MLKDFILHCTLSLIDPICPTLRGLQNMCYAPIICSSWAWVCMCHALITCSSGACEASSMPPLHVVSDHLAHMPCPHCMKFCSLHGICHATITCSSWLPCQYRFICILPPLVINCYHHTMISWIMNTRKLSTPLPYALHSPQFLQCQYHCHHYYYYITIAILMRLPSQLQLIFQCLQHTNTSG